MILTSKNIYRKAQRENYAIPAANFMDTDMLKWHIEVAEELNLPIIVALAQAHIGEMITLEEAAQAATFYGGRTSTPVVLHLDHGNDFDIIKRAIDCGFTSVMIDASMDNFTNNVKRTNEVIEYAHKRNVVVEAEIGHVGSGVNYENHDQADSIFTSVDDAVRFTEETDVDSLAVSIGTAHGHYKGVPKINFERLTKIKKEISVPLVLHGGSSSGDDNLKRCATGGISKINIFSDFLTAAEQALREQGYPSYVNTKDIMKKSMQNCLMHYYKVFQTC